ncbi:MAG: diacylglycerol kinase [Patescibacteria group bacterium]|nr:diacylglycerol kinase [Patescibacteria group bacterium]MBU1870866.1 diacylglycerol kinase [Patescibacteria group bacterium]
MIKITKLAKSFIYAWRGLNKVFKEEQNLKIQLIMGLLIITLAWYFQVNLWELIVLILIIILVILMELANSAVERITDVLKPRINGYVKDIKDIMAAAVLVASIAAIIVGLLIFLPYLNKLVGNN